MSSVELKQQAKSIIEELPARDLKLAVDLLAAVSGRRLNAATRELLAIPGFVRSFERGMKDIAAGRVVPWRQVRRDV